MDYNYAREKLNLLLRDLDSYTDDEFWRQMSRIAAGATGEDHAEEIAKERDALAAHVEDVRAACISGGQWAERVIAIGRVLNQSPTTSLARLKAEWQAEALQQLADDYYGEISPRTVANRAAELRRQAEEAP